jgi:hypothetical protein
MFLLYSLTPGVSGRRSEENSAGKQVLMSSSTLCRKRSDPK